MAGFLDTETGIFRYYGDNRKPGRLLTDTKLKGNQLLEEIFNCLNGKGKLDDIPPFLIFKKTGEGRNVQFLGLAVPGNPKISPDRDLVAFGVLHKGNVFKIMKLISQYSIRVISLFCGNGFNTGLMIMNTVMSMHPMHGWPFKNRDVMV